MKNWILFFTVLLVTACTPGKEEPSQEEQKPAVCFDNWDQFDDKLAYFKELIDLQDLRWLQPMEGMDGGSGLIGTLPRPERDSDFLRRIKQIFGVECLRHSGCSGREIRTVALCGGAGAFLMRNAVRQGADCFVTGEFHYHDYFENDGMLLAELGHFQSEQYTIGLLADLLKAGCPSVEVVETSVNTNPTRYDA